MSLPLDGLTVVALEQAVAAPFCTRQLADMGAEVIKIERLDGGDFARRYDRTVHGYSSFFVWLNRSKRSLALDVKHPSAHEILDRLLSRADVFVQNLGPGAATRLGLGDADLRQRYPHLVVCAISGYGADGPYRDQKAYDLLIQAESGLTSITGSPQNPAKVGISVCDIAAGMYAFAGVTLALLDRGRTRQGRTVEVSLFDAMAEWMSAPTLFTRYGGMPPPRTGVSHHSIYPYGPVPCADGRQIVLAIQNEREWARLCRDVLEQPALAGDERFSTNVARNANRAALDALLAAAFARFTVDEAAQVLERAGIAQARLNDVTALLDHPQLSERGRWLTVETPAGPARTVAPAIILDGAMPVTGPVPALGEHSAEIVASLGYDEEQVTELMAHGVIAGA